MELYICANTCNAVQSNLVESCGDSGTLWSHVDRSCGVMWRYGVPVGCMCSEHVAIRPFEVCAAYWDDEEQLIKTAT